MINRTRTRLYEEYDKKATDNNQNGTLEEYMSKKVEIMV